MTGNATEAAVKWHGVLRLSGEFLCRSGHARLANLNRAGVLLPAVAELATVFWLLVFGVKRPAKGKPTLVAA